MELEQEPGGHPATSSKTLVPQDDRQVLGPQAMEIRYCNSIGFVHGLPYSTLFSSSVDYKNFIIFFRSPQEDLRSQEKKTTKKGTKPKRY